MSVSNIDVPHERNLVWKTKSGFADSLCNDWANKTITDKMMAGKGNAPRIILAKLYTQHDVAEANKWLMKNTVWGISGSTWALNKKGDYDFTVTIYTSILWLFGEHADILYPATKDYLLNVLLTEDGNKFRTAAPHSLGLARETENHILMTEGSRYLKNRWLMLHGDTNTAYNNEENGMETKILNTLEHIKSNGLFEFNSLPYIGYTITALLNLEAFASDKIRLEARAALDYMNWTYALGSYQLKHYGPMRRRYEKAKFQELANDYQSIFMKAWLSFSPITTFNKSTNGGEVHALMGSIMPYRPADKVVKTIFDKGDGYFIKLGHGPKSCPEIYTAGKHYLLSAGGANQGKKSIIVARPICLFLDDTAVTLSGVIHVAGPGNNFMEWNNTGVYKNFACAAGPVYVPASFKSVVEKENWKIYPAKNNLMVAVYSTDEFGLIAVFEDTNANALLAKLMQANENKEQLKSQFKFPEGHKLMYDVQAPKNKWVIISEDNKIFNRDFNKWPLIDGELK